jgi:hypothetical protein
VATVTASGSGRGGRPPGLPKTGGRAKGTPNKSTLALREKLAALGCDPDEELVKIACDSKTDTGQKVAIYSLFFRHIHPVPKPVANSNEDPTPKESTMTIDEMLRLSHFVIDRYGPKAAQQKNPDSAQQQDSTLEDVDPSTIEEQDEDRT